MSDAILLFLGVDAVVLLLLGAGAAALPRAGYTAMVAGLSGLGLLLSLTALVTGAAATTLAVGFGPPGLGLRIGLDPLSLFFLVIVFMAGAALTAFQAGAPPVRGRSRKPRVAPPRRMALCLSGAVWSILGGDGVSLAIGLAVMGGAMWLPGAGRRDQAAMVIPLVVLAAIGLLTPAGVAPHFDTIRAAWVEPYRAAAGGVLTIASAGFLIGARAPERGWTGEALMGGMLMPAAAYLLLRVLVDLAGATAGTGCGFVLLVGGGTIALLEGWRSASVAELEASAGCLVRRQGGLAMAGIGLALIARAADLPAAAGLALAATFLAVLGGSVGGLVSVLAGHAIGVSAGTSRLSRLGGVVHGMPVTSGALAGGLLCLSALPPGAGFASLWLLFEAILAAPRTGGLLFQVPLALAGAAVAASAALATAGSVRVAGIALLGRPRTPQGAGVCESRTLSRASLAVLAALAVLVGVLPGPFVWLLAGRSIEALAGGPFGGGIGLTLLPGASPGYLALPVFGLVGVVSAVVVIVPRWWGAERKAGGLWADGMEPPVGLPFGDPAAQSVGKGFLPALPALGGFAGLPAVAAVALPRIPKLAVLASPRRPSAGAGLWILLAAMAGILLVLAVHG